MSGSTSAQRSAIAPPARSDLAVTSPGENPTKGPTMAVALRNTSVMWLDRTLCNRLCSW